METTAPAAQTLDCTDPVAVRGHFLQLATGVVHAARIAADPRLSDPMYRVVPEDADTWFRYLHEAQVMEAASGSSGGVGIPDDAFHQRRLLALVQSYAQLWGSGHGRTLKAEYAAQLTDAAAFLATEAVTASLAGLETNPHDVADRLHRAIDNAQSWHLAEVGGHSEVDAYADSRFHAAIQAAGDSMGATSSRPRMAQALQTAMDMVVREAGEEDGSGPAGRTEPVAAEPPESGQAQLHGRTWTITTQSGFTSSGYLPAWAEDDPSRLDLPANRLQLAVEDLTFERYYPGPEVVVDGPFGEDGRHTKGPSALAAATMFCSPFAENAEHRQPYVTVAILEDCVIDSMGPDQVADLAGKLRAQADVLDQAAADLTAARADWAANGGAQ